MRLSLLLLVTLTAIGCGAGSGDRPHRLVGSGFFSPSISMLSPTSVPVNSPPFTITVVGNNFGADAVVFWNGTPAATIPVNSKELMAQITALDLQTVGAVPIYVRTGGQNSNTVDFQVATQ
jgi:hypothetical protein